MEVDDVALDGRRRRRRRVPVEGVAELALGVVREREEARV